MNRTRAIGQQRSRTSSDVSPERRSRACTILNLRTHRPGTVCYTQPLYVFWVSVSLKRKRRSRDLATRFSNLAVKSYDRLCAEMFCTSAHRMTARCTDAKHRKSARLPHLPHAAPQLHRGRALGTAETTCAGALGHLPDGRICGGGARASEPAHAVSCARAPAGPGIQPYFLYPTSHSTEL